jgi:sugar phosphate permease
MMKNIEKFKFILFCSLSIVGPFAINSGLLKASDIGSLASTFSITFAFSKVIRLMCWKKN